MATSLAPGQPRLSAVVHGMHPLRGYPVTWHLTPVAGQHHRSREFLVEAADGHIDDERVWALAEKDTVVLTAAEASELVRRVTRHTH
ncbi:MAG: hypothetical protein JWP95_317 [Actinotalea sp.]|nr:hypothetical protein [Actinotalea sp.]